MATGGGLGIGTGLGALGLGGPQAVQPFALPTMATKALPYVAHLYDHNLSFKRTLGGASIISKPNLKLTQNGGYQPITIEVASSVSGLALGDVIRLTENGDASAAILFSGNVETIPEEQAAGSTHHQISVTPWVSELGDTYFNQTYAVATDVAQFVRDAVALTAHCSVSPISCPNTGITAIYDFQQTNALDAIHVAKQIAGANYWYFTDAQGVVWFQPVYTANPATITVKKGADYQARKTSTTIAGMKNRIPVMGGQAAGGVGKLSSGYGVGSDPLGNQALYGVRTFNPTPSYPTVTDQATLDAIAASLGAQFDRTLTTTEIVLSALGIRLIPGRAGGLTLRYFEPAVSPNAPPGAGTYSSVYVVQDIDVAGPVQTVVVGDIPYTDTDTTYEALRVAQRLAVVAAPASTGKVTLLPPIYTPAGLAPRGFASGGHTVYAAGGGVVTVATATFTTVRAGTVQVLGQIDARAVNADDYTATPRRAVNAVLSGGIFTGAWQELPYGGARAIYDLSSAPGITLPAGTYTVSVQIDTQSTNQIEVFSAWVQCVTTA